MAISSSGKEQAENPASRAGSVKSVNRKEGNVFVSAATRSSKKLNVFSLEGGRE